MVTLSRLYTRTGDGGTTRLGDMSQVPKTSPRIAAYGCVDELNSAIGLARSSGAAHDDVLARVQNDLFDLGADLCVPQEDGGEEERLRVQPRQVLFLEQQIDRLTRDLAPLRSFVLPGGRQAAAWLHLARTVCRQGRARRLAARRAGTGRRAGPAVSQPAFRPALRLGAGSQRRRRKRMCCGSPGRARPMPGSEPKSAATPAGQGFWRVV